MILELQQQRHDHDALRQQLSEVEGESRDFAKQFAEIEERNMNLANLYVSSYQLHGTLDRGAVLESIKEILINLIGCEELAVFELSEDAAALDLVTSFGIDDDAIPQHQHQRPCPRQAGLHRRYVHRRGARHRPTTRCP